MQCVAAVPPRTALARLASRARTARTLLASPRRAGSALRWHAHLLADQLVHGALVRVQSFGDRFTKRTRGAGAAAESAGTRQGWRGPTTSASADIAPVVASPGIHIDLVGTTASTGEIATLVGDLSGDIGCAPGQDGHRACTAARRLGEIARPGADTLRELEDTVLLAERPACVRRAAVEALARIATEDARRALERMADVTRQRVAWDARPEDVALLARLAG